MDPYANPLLSEKDKQENNIYPIPQVNVQPILYPNQNVIITNQQLIPSYQPVVPVQYSSANQSSLELLELLQELPQAQEVIISKYTCGGFLNFGMKTQYIVRLKYINGFRRNIFICQKRSNLTNNNYEVRMKYIPRNVPNTILKTKDFTSRIVDILCEEVSEHKLHIEVINVVNNMTLGSIEKPINGCCCCSGPRYVVYSRYSKNNTPKYFITVNPCQCSYCCSPSCCCSGGQANFQIYDNETSSLLGNIIKMPYSIFRTGFLEYNIRFPPNTTNEEKLLFIGTAIVIDNIEYEHVGSKMDNVY